MCVYLLSLSAGWLLSSSSVSSVFSAQSLWKVDRHTSLRRTRTGAGTAAGPDGGFRDAAGSTSAFLNSFSSGEHNTHTHTETRRQTHERRLRAGRVHSLAPDAWTLLRLLLFVRDSWLELSLNPLQLDWRIRAEQGRGLDSASKTGRECDVDRATRVII